MNVMAIDNRDDVYSPGGCSSSRNLVFKLQTKT